MKLIIPCDYDAPKIVLRKGTKRNLTKVGRLKGYHTSEELKVEFVERFGAIVCPTKDLRSARWSKQDEDVARYVAVEGAIK